MGANSPISRAGTQFRKPIESLDLMVGAARQSNHVASLPEKVEAPSLLSIQPECGLRCRPAVQQSFEKVTARVKAEVPHPARCTTLRLRLRKLMQLNERSRPSANLLGLSF